VQQRTSDDPNLHDLDGRDLYGEADVAELPLPDGLHLDGEPVRSGDDRERNRQRAAGPAYKRGSSPPALAL
jgi:hypothetical protein